MSSTVLYMSMSLDGFIAGPSSFAFAPMLALVALLVTVWAVTGAGAFWPIWILLGVWWFRPLRHRRCWAHGRRALF